MDPDPERRDGNLSRLWNPSAASEGVPTFTIEITDLQYGSCLTDCVGELGRHSTGDDARGGAKHR